jgi:hypothetical protein
MSHYSTSGSTSSGSSGPTGVFRDGSDLLKDISQGSNKTPAQQLWSWIFELLLVTRVPFLANLGPIPLNVLTPPAPAPAAAAADAEAGAEGHPPPLPVEVLNLERAPQLTPSLEPQCRSGFDSFLKQMQRVLDNRIRINLAHNWLQPTFLSGNAEARIQAATINTMVKQFS